MAVLDAGPIDDMAAGGAASDLPDQPGNGRLEWGLVERSWKLPEGLFRARVRVGSDASIVLVTAPVRLAAGTRVRVGPGVREAALVWKMRVGDSQSDPNPPEGKSFASRFGVEPPAPVN